MRAARRSWCPRPAGATPSGSGAGGAGRRRRCASRGSGAPSACIRSSGPWPRVAQSLYITAMEPGSGKSIISLGVMEILAGKAQHATFFRPIVATGSERDPQIELIRRRYRLESSYEEMHALTAEQAQALIAASRH